MIKLEHQPKPYSGNGLINLLMPLLIIQIEAAIVQYRYRKLIPIVNDYFILCGKILFIFFRQLVKSYCFATSGALATALSLNSLAKRFPPLVGRFVPLAAGRF